MVISIIGNATTTSLAQRTTFLPYTTHSLFQCVWGFFLNYYFPLSSEHTFSAHIFPFCTRQKHFGLLNILLDIYNEQNVSCPSPYFSLSLTQLFVTNFL